MLSLISLLDMYRISVCNHCEGELLKLYPNAIPGYIWQAFWFLTSTAWACCNNVKISYSVKICNNVKISYICIPNLKSVIQNRNVSLLSKHTTPVAVRSCSCSQKSECLLNNKCLSEVLSISSFTNTFKNKQILLWNLWKKTF